MLVLRYRFLFLMQKFICSSYLSLHGIFPATKGIAQRIIPAITKQAPKMISHTIIYTSSIFFRDAIILSFSETRFNKFTRLILYKITAYFCLLLPIHSQKSPGIAPKALFSFRFLHPILM